MKQLVVRQSDGSARIVGVPAPGAPHGGVVVQTRASVVSVGTEKAGVEFGRKSMVGKAASRPEQVKQVVQMALRDGVLQTADRVRAKLQSEWAPGYSSAGVITAVGAGVRDLQPGQRVACAGAGHAVHAERVGVPQNLVVPIPDNVSFEAAAFTTLGAIALQGVRQADVRLGETVAVIGLGLLGQLTVQLLKASGVRPIAIDLDASRVALATELGAAGIVRADDVERAVHAQTGGIGADAVIITAATRSRDPVLLAGHIARDRGRVIIVGDVPIDVPRSPYYEKEVDVRLSRSYGPGRYDPEYEEKGRDYPVGYVRWTERRNMAEFLRLVSVGAVRVEPLITHRFAFDDAERGYGEVMGDDVKPAPLGVVLHYPEDIAVEPARIALAVQRRAVQGATGVGLLGPGSFALDVLLPALKPLGVELRGVVSARGLSARGAGERHGFAYVAASLDDLLADEQLDALVIATPHADHAAQAAAALRAGRAVFVEKPLALGYDELRDVLDAAAGGAPLMVGFNRRFAPATRFVMERLARTSGARVITMRVNAGRIPAKHWIHDPEIGGGRLLGEVCHFIDLAAFLAGARTTHVAVAGIGSDDPDAMLQDNLVVTLRHANGSTTAITYTSKGDPAAGKERIEVFAGGVTCAIDDFARAEVWRGGKAERWKGNQDKGHREEMRLFIEAVRTGGSAPIDLAALESSSLATLRAADALRSGGVEVVLWPEAAGQ